jgi:hypothetical protein
MSGRGTMYGVKQGVAYFSGQSATRVAKEPNGPHGKIRAFSAIAGEDACDNWLRHVLSAGVKIVASLSNRWRARRGIMKSIVNDSSNRPVGVST